MQKWEYCQIIYDPVTNQISVRLGKEKERKEILTDTTLFEIIQDLGLSGWEAFSQIRTPDNQFEMWLRRPFRQPQPGEEGKAIEFILSPDLADYIAEKEPKIWEDLKGRGMIDDKST